MNNENREHCKHIALTVEKYADGEHYICPECGDLIEQLETDAYGHETWRCASCGHEMHDDEPETATLYDYFSDVLDIEYVVNADKKTVKGGRLLVAYGGPNIYIDTMKRAVTLHWWTEYAEYSLSHNVCDTIDEWLQEMWDC